VSKCLRYWDIKLSHVKFTYNWTPSYAISHSHFEVCYGFNPLTPLDLIPIPQESKVDFKAEERAKAMKKLHEQVRAQIEKVNEQYKTKANKNQTHLEFKPGDLVWLHLRKERFPSRRKRKLMARGDDPYKIVQRVGDNAYKVELLGDMNFSATFNVGDVTPYIEDEDEDIGDLKENSLQGVEV